MRTELGYAHRHAGSVSQTESGGWVARHQWIARLGLGLLGGCLLLAFAPLGMWQFGGWDGSSLTLSAWYMTTGVVPYRDVPYTLPPFFLIGAGWAFRIFGIHWWAFVAMNAIFALATYAWLIDQLRLIGFRFQLAVAVAFVMELAATMVIAYWWYSATTAIVVVLVFVSSLACLARPACWRSWVSVSASLMLLLVSKPNSWPVGACVVLLLTGNSTAVRLRAAIAAVIGLLAAFFFCVANGVQPLNVLRWYSRVAQTRGVPLTLDAIPGWDSRGALIGLTILAVLVFRAGRREWREHWREYACCAAAGLTSAWMGLTNMEYKTMDLVPLGVVAIVLAFRPWSRRQFDVSGRVLAILVLCSFTAAAAYLGLMRLRIRDIGPRVFFEVPASHEFSQGFFDGVRTGPRLPRVLSQMDDAVQRHPGKTFFGPRIEFGYAAYNKIPPRGIPPFWHPGTAYGAGDVPAIVTAFRDARFDSLIFLKRDFTRMPLDILLQMRDQYVRIEDYPELTVFVRKQP